MGLRLIRAQSNRVVSALTCAQHEIAEWSFRSSGCYANPWAEIELDAVISGPSGQVFRVPAFWAGGDNWRVRFAPPVVGHYTLTTICSNAQDRGLHAQLGQLTVTAYTGDNPLLQHGPLHMTADGGHLAHADGLPFLWLGDTWWLGLTQRFVWPDTFQTLVADRRDKGFNVIQLLGGLACDMPAHDPRGANEGGLAWEPGYTRINPAFFDWADLRIDWLAAEGLVPCLFGAWSFYLQWMGVERIKQHWRYLVARYGAFPVIWCLAGGGTMPYYLSEDKEGDREVLRQGWTQVAHYVKAIDPYARPMALHRSPRQAARGELGEDVPHDLSMHSMGSLLQETDQAAWRACAGEVCFPGMLTAERHALHRAAFWMSILSGAKGFTYGLSGIWQAGSEEHPFGPSPNGHTWPNTPWNEALRLDSSDQVGRAKALLERHRWWAFASHPEWIATPYQPDSRRDPFAAGIPGEIRLIYFPEPLGVEVRVCGLEPELAYQARWINPRDGHEIPLAQVAGQSCWLVPPLPSNDDWLLVLQVAAG